jgi:hypothetical protein
VSPLSAESRRLDFILRHLGWDGLLSTLADWVRLPESGVGVPVTLIVDGFLVRGVLAPSDRFAQDADTKIAKGMESANITGSVSEEHSERVRAQLAQDIRGASLLEHLAQSGRRYYQESQVRLQSHVEGLPEGSRLGLDDVPEDLWPDFLNAEGPFLALTLEQSEIFHPATGWTSIGYMRVQMDHIGAWWISS